MKALLNFMKKIERDKKRSFQKRIEEFKLKNSPEDWNGNVLKIKETAIIYLYLSEDK